MKKQDLKFILIGVVYFCITFFTDRNIFDFNNINLVNYIFCKFLLFIILVLGSLFLAKVFRKDNKCRLYLKNFLIFVIPMLILLYFLWPGTWFGSDVYNFYSFTIKCEFLYYLNYLTSVFYIVGYMLFACPSGAIIFQTLLFGVVFSFIITNCWEIYKTKKVYLLIIPFILFHTIFYVFFANRPIIFGLFYLLLISILLIDYKKQVKKLDNKKLLIIALLTGIVGFWRSETIYLVIAIPILLFVVYHEKVCIKNIVKIFGVCLVSYILISLPQRIYYNNNSSKLSTRNLPMFVGGISYMLTYDLDGKNLAEDLENIDKVLNVDSMKQYPSYVDTPCVWQGVGCIRQTFTEDEYKTFVKSYFNIIKNNVDKFLYSKLKTFTLASGINYDYFTTYNLYKSNDDKILDRDDTKPNLDYKVRQNIYKVLEGKTSNNFYNNIYRLTNNFLIPMLFLGIIFIWSIFRKNLFYFLLTGMLLGHVVILFITSPAAYFMYYFNVYMCGWVIGLFFIIDKIKIKK